MSHIQLGVGRKCRAVKRRFVYGLALQFVPRGTDGGAYNTYQFKVCRLKETYKERGESQTTVSYILEPTEKVVMATNTSRLYVLAGNKVILTEDLTGGYDVYCECSQYKFGTVMEPSLGLIDPAVRPNFTFCGSDGIVMPLNDILHSVSCRNALSVGLLAVPEKEYPLLHAVWNGGEPYISNGEIKYRSAGTQRKTSSSAPLYYRKRSIVITEGYAQHKEFGNTTTSSRISKVPVAAYANSPFAYKYSDDSDFGFAAPLCFHTGHVSVNWKMTEDIHDAMRQYDYFICPKQADNEVFPIGTLVEIIRETAVTNYLPHLNEKGEITDNPHTTVIPYYEVHPPVDEYIAELEGQGLTYGVFYDTEGDRIVEVPEEHNVKEKIRKTLCRGFWEQNRSVPIVSRDYVMNIPERYPCRGVFLLYGEDGTRYPQLCMPHCETGFGLPVMYHDVMDTRKTNRHFFSIRREWINNAFGSGGRWELVIHPDFPYKSVGELPGWDW